MSARPELGKLSVGDELIVTEDPTSRRPRNIRVRIVKAAPVWIDVEAVDGKHLRESRFRRDNQTAKAKPEGWTPCFHTLAQWEWRERSAQAYAYLRAIGVHAESGSRFSGDSLGLANVIRRGLGEPEL